MASKTRAVVKYRNRYIGRRFAHRAKKMTLPLAPMAGLFVGMAPVIEHIAKGNFEAGANAMAYRYTGWSVGDKNWKVDRLKYGLLPLVTGMAVHKLVGGSLGVNRALARAGIPLLRL